MNIDAKEITGTIRELNQFATDFEKQSEPAAKMFRHASWIIRQLAGQLIDAEHLALLLTDRLNELGETENREWVL